MDIEGAYNVFSMIFYQRAGEQLDYLRPPFTIKDLTDCIFMEAIKQLYYETMPKSSLRSHLIKNELLIFKRLKNGQLDEDELNERHSKRFSRLMNYVQYYRTMRSNMIVSDGGVAPNELCPDDLSSTPARMAGHRITEMQFFEMQVINELPLLKAIVNKRIINREKISHIELRALLDGYANYVEKLKTSAKDGDEQYVFNTFALYTLESVFCIDFSYAAICEAEKIPGSDLFDAARLLTGKSLVFTEDGGIITDNRFVLHRKDLIPSALQKNLAEEVYKKMSTYLRIKDEALWGINDEHPVVDFLRETTTLKDWADFMRRHYPLVESHTTYDWTNKRIRSYRELMKRMIEDVPPPKSPPKKNKKKPSSLKSKTGKIRPKPPKK